MFKFLPGLFGFWSFRKHGLIRKTRLISKFMTSQPRKQRIAIHKLPNISRSKGNQKIKFGQLIEHNMRNIFPEKSYEECGGKTMLSFSNFALYSKGLVSQGFTS